MAGQPTGGAGQQRGRGDRPRLGFNPWGRAPPRAHPARAWRLPARPARRRVAARVRAPGTQRRALGEFCELRGKDLDREGRHPVLRVRRSYSVKATRDPNTGERVTTGRVKVPKSRHSRRDIPLSPTMARPWRLQRGPDELLFATLTGERLRRENVYRRVLAPAAEVVGVEWPPSTPSGHLRLAAVRAGPQHQAGPGEPSLFRGDWPSCFRRQFRAPGR
jgi:hypothetical protein